MKRILVACGTAIATSTVVAKKIEGIFKDKGYSVYVEQCKATEAGSKASSFDLIVATTPVSGTGDTPVLQTVSFLTGIGIDDDINKILSLLNLE